MCRRTARRQRRHIGPKFNHRPCGAFLLVHRTRSLSVVLLWPRCYMAQRLGRSVCLSLSHTLTNTHSHWCSPATSKNVLPSPSRAEPSRAWALRAGYNRSPLLLLIYWWHLQDVAPPYVVGRVGFLFFSFLWWDAEAEKQECVSGRTTARLNRRKMKTEETCVDEKRRDQTVNI